MKNQLFNCVAKSQLIFITFFCNFIFAGTNLNANNLVKGIISGRVLDALNGSPVEFANVAICKIINYKKIIKNRKNTLFGFLWSIINRLNFIKA